MRSTTITSTGAFEGTSMSPSCSRIAEKKAGSSAPMSPAVHLSVKSNVPLRPVWSTNPWDPS